MNQFKQTMEDGSRPDVYGFLVWWNLESDIGVDRETLKRFLSNRGLGPAIPTENTPTTAFRRGLRDIRNQHTHVFIPDLTKGNKDETGSYKLWTSIQRLSRDGVAEQDSFHQDNAVRFQHTRKNKKRGVHQETITLEANDTTDPLFIQLQSLYNRHMTLHNTYDIYSVINKTLSSSHAILARQNGGVYFIPYKGMVTDTLVDQLEAFINEDISNGADATSFSILEVPVAARQQRTLQRSAANHLEKEVEQLMADIEKAKESKSDKSLKNQLEHAKEFESKVHMYEHLLEYKIDKARSMLEAITLDAEKALLARAIGQDGDDGDDADEEAEPSSDDGFDVASLLKPLSKVMD